MFQVFPELHFGCKIKIYASEKHLVTKWRQIMRFRKWDQSGTWISTTLQRFARKMFFRFSRIFLAHPKKSRVFLKSSLVVDNHRPFKWLTDIFLGREICSQIVFMKSSLLAVDHRPLEWFWDIFLGREIFSPSWGIIFRKWTKFQIFESQENVWPIFYMKQLESDKIKDMAELALRSKGGIAFKAS